MPLRKKTRRSSRLEQGSDSGTRHAQPFNSTSDMMITHENYLTSLYYFCDRTQQWTDIMTVSWQWSYPSFPTLGCLDWVHSSHLMEVFSFELLLWLTCRKCWILKTIYKILLLMGVSLQSMHHSVHPISLSGSSDSGKPYTAQNSLRTLSSGFLSRGAHKTPREVAARL